MNTVANPLTLVMPIRTGQYAALKAKVEELQALPDAENPILKALKELRVVHYARFVFLFETHLAVITTYDNSFEEYIDLFVEKIGDVFNLLLSYVEGAPPLPVQSHRQEFLDFVRRYDYPIVGNFFSAYPDLKTLDILTLASERGGSNDA